jgi:hypothetical protein
MLDIKDLKSLGRGLDHLQQKLDDAAKRALADTAVKVLLDSQELVPVDTGALKASGAISEVKETNDGYEVVISYNTDYAARVHEDLDANHPHGGQAKYLEVPFHQAGETLATALSRVIK